MHLSRGQRSIVFVSHTTRGGNFVVGSHHYSREFARRGWAVAHVSTPFSTVHRILGRGTADRRVAASEGWQESTDGVWDLVPRTLLPAGFGSGSYLRRALAQALRGGFDYAVVDQPRMGYSRLSSSARRLVYRPTDSYFDSISHRAEKRMVRSFSGVVATSEPVLARLSVPVSTPALVLANGVDTEHFSQASEGQSRRGAVYVGALDARFDWSSVAMFASSRPEIPFDLYGPLVQPPIDLPSNIRLLGPIAYDEVPVVLSQYRLGLLPLSRSPENLGRSPMKLFEYLASGLTVLASRTPVTEKEGGFGVFTYSSDDWREPFGEAWQFSANINRDGVKRSDEMSWADRADKLEEFLLSLD